MTEENKAVEQAEASATGGAAGILERLAQRLGGAVSVSAVFGEPVERDGVTVIPVARVGFGLGAGAGAGSRGTDTEVGWGGGGGGGSAAPAGFIEIREGGAVFRPIREPLSTLLVPLAGVVAGTLVPQIVRGLRRRRKG